MQPRSQGQSSLPLLSLGFLPKTREAEKRDPGNEVGPNDGKELIIADQRKCTQDLAKHLSGALRLIC